jgi:hypothetical protein
MVSTAQDIMDRYGIDQDFAASIESLGNDLGVDPMYLANTMYAESRLDPSVKNMAGSGGNGSDSVYASNCCKPWNYN